MVEEVDGCGAFAQVDGVGFWGGEVEAFDVAAGGLGVGEGGEREGGAGV